MPIADGKAYIQKMEEFQQAKKGGETDGGDEWADNNKPYRVGIQLKGRDMKPIYFYSQSLHDAKFLLVNIKLFGDQGRAEEMSNMLEIAYQIEKVARFQKIMSMMCFAKEKRFVAMHGFQ